MFSEWLLSMEESIKALKPDDAVVFVGSYLEPTVTRRNGS